MIFSRVFFVFRSLGWLQIWSDNRLLQSATQKGAWHGHCSSKGCCMNQEMHESQGSEQEFISEMNVGRIQRGNQICVDAKNWTIRNDNQLTCLKDLKGSAKSCLAAWCRLGWLGPGCSKQHSPYSTSAPEPGGRDPDLDPRYSQTEPQKNPKEPKFLEHRWSRADQKRQAKFGQQLWELEKQCCSGEDTVSICIHLSFRIQVYCTRMQ